MEQRTWTIRSVVICIIFTVTVHILGLRLWKKKKKKVGEPARLGLSTRRDKRKRSEIASEMNRLWMCTKRGRDKRWSSGMLHSLCTARKSQSNQRLGAKPWKQREEESEEGRERRGLPPFQSLITLSAVDWSQATLKLKGLLQTPQLITTWNKKQRWRSSFFGTTGVKLFM